MVKNKLCAIVNLTESEDQLKPLTHNRPIAALPFAGRYRVLDFYLSSIAHADIDSCALFISESGRSIYDHIRSGEAWNFDSRITGGIFTFSQQNWKIRHVSEHGNVDFYDNHRLYMARSRAKDVFVSGSKFVANVDIKAIQRHHHNSGAAITLVHRPVELTRDVSKISDTVVQLNEDGKFQSLAPITVHQVGDKVFLNLNMYLLSVETAHELLKRAESEGVYMELDALVQRYIEDYNVNTFEYTGYAANIETIDRYFDAHMDMLDRAKYRSLFYTSLPVLTKSKNGVPSYYAEESKVTESIIATGVRVDGLVHRSIINRKVRVHKDAQVLNSIVFQDTTIGQGARVEYAIIDKSVEIEPGAQIIGSPDNIIVIGKNTRVKADAQ